MRDLDNAIKPWILGFMAGTTGLEPATSAVTGQRSNQLSYVPKLDDQLGSQIARTNSSRDSLAAFNQRSR
jgi:hypothetical protein